MPHHPDPTGVVVVEVVVDPDDADLISGALWAAGAVAVAEESVGDRVLLRSAPGPDSSVEVMADAARSWAPALAGTALEVRVVAVTDDGLDGWRAHARPWRAGRRLVVWPAWHEADSAPGVHRPGPDDVVVAIDPGRAFGSGSHPSTRLALAALEPVVQAGDAVLDVGCGSGVLAIAAVLLGASAATAADVDPEALTATAANAAANGVADRVIVTDRPLAELVGAGIVVPVVVANILAPVLRSLGPDLATATAPGGHVVVAGPLLDQLDDVVRAIGLPEVARDDLDGWGCATLINPT